MKKQSRMMFGITKRRRFVATLVVIMAVCVAAFLILGYVGVFGLRSELCEVAVTPDKAGDAFGGVGVNCDLIPNINLIRDASFESSTDYSSMLIAGASENSVFLTPSTVSATGYDAENCSGDTARIISIDSDGAMSEKFTGVITGYKPARMGAITMLKDSKDLWSEDRITDMAFFGNMTLALTESGRIIYDVTNSSLTGVVDSKEKFSFIETNDTGIIAVTSKGFIFSSQDGKNFSQIYENSGSEVCGVGNAGTTFAICYRNGTIVSVTNGNVAVSELPCVGVTSFLSDGQRFLATDLKGQIYTSSNGMVFEKSGECGWLKERTNLLVSALDGLYCIVVDNSRAVVVTKEYDGYSVEKVEISRDTGSTIETINITNSGLIITGTSDKKAYAINLATGNAAALTSENVIVENIIGVSGDRVFFDSGNDLYRSQILAELSIGGNLEGVDIIADDILVVGHAHKAAGGAISVTNEDDSAWSISDESEWNVYGRGTNLIMTDRAYSGKFGARISGSGSALHAVTQELHGAAMENFVEGTFYRLSLYAMSDNAPENAYCWIEGEGFGRYGFELTQLNGNYKNYSCVFAVTDRMTEAGKITVSIAFEGVGYLLVDDLYLGPDSYEAGAIPQFYSDTLAAGRPSALRLNNLNIGGDGFAETSLYLMSQNSVSGNVEGTASGIAYVSEGVHNTEDDLNLSVTGSLEDSLRLVKQCDSCPWFVIGPYVSQSDIDKFLEYMCGSLTSEYGGKRIDNGTALPWSRQFTRIYIEVNDSGKVFQSDVQKASYVNYVISMFTQSEYFGDIKDKSIFLDGMEYTGGTMMSDADNHTMSIDLVNKDTNQTFINNVDSSYVIAQYETPHIVNGTSSGEYIRTLDTEGKNCGQIMSALITSEADFAELFLFDANVNFVPSCYFDEKMFIGGERFINMMAVSGLTTDFTGYDELFIDLKEPLDTTAAANVDSFMSDVSTACFSDGSKTYLVIANASEVQQSFLINDNRLGRTNSVMRRYDSTGRQIDERVLRRERLRHILQPGEFIIVEIESV